MNRREESTAPDLLIKNVRNQPLAIAYRAKTLGIYKGRTWQQYAEAVERAALILAALGLAAGDRVASIGECSEDLVHFDLATQASGGVALGIYPAATATEMRHILSDSGSSIVICENQQFVDRLLMVIDDLPLVRCYR